MYIRVETANNPTKRTQTPVLGVYPYSEAGSGDDFVREIIVLSQSSREISVADEHSPSSMSSPL